MSRFRIEPGNRLISVMTPGQGGSLYHVGGGIMSITVVELPGSGGFYLAADIRYEDERPDLVIPLHMAESFEVQFAD